MTYEEFINGILESRGRFACGDEYHERHHILPKCMGGNNDEKNLIDLYAREHFIAHRLLALENPGNSGLIYAWHCMSVLKRDDLERYEPTPEEYEEARKSYCETLSEKMSGVGHFNYGKHLSEDVKNKISESHKGIPAWNKGISGPSGENASFYGKRHTKESIEKMSKAASLRTGDKNPFYGKHHSDEVKEKMRKSKLGKHLSEDVKAKISKVVNQYDVDGNYIKTYNSLLEAANCLNTTSANISSALRKKTKTACGFIWFYADDPTQPDKSKIISIQQNDSREDTPYETEFFKNN